MKSRFGFRGLSGSILALVLSTAALSTSAWGGVFGRVVAIGGNASDIALDERRGVLYIANFTANRIEVMSTSDLSIGRSINVNPQPGSIALSPNGRYLVIGHYGNNTEPVQSINALTVLNLEQNTRQIYALGHSPLGVAFGSDGLALILTTGGEFLLLDPATGVMTAIDNIAGLPDPTKLPVIGGKFPPDITKASMAAAGNGLLIHGLTDTIQFIYDVQTKTVSAFNYTATPPLGPRIVSVSQDGSLAVDGWSVTDYRRFVSYDFPNPSGLLSIGTHAVDSAAGVIYAQIPPPLPPPPPPASATACLPDGRCLTITNAPSTTTAASQPPTLSIVDADNLTIREQFRLAENLAGRSVLNAAGDRMYSISDSGVTVFAVGSALRLSRRLTASKEDLVLQTNSCDSRIVTQTITITDPGGGRTGFSLLPLAPGISISPSSGFTPATVQVSFNPITYRNQKGTTTIPVQLTTNDGVNEIPSLTDPTSSLNVAAVIRVLINNHDVDQRGSVISVPGTLKDILADNTRDRYYVLRQDKNQVLVFNAVNNTQIATLRTGNLPTQMAITRDSKYLLVGSDSAQYITVFDLDTMQPDRLIAMPFGHYPRSVAASGNAILAASRVAGPKNLISRVDLASRQANNLGTLGIYQNDINPDTILVGTPNGSSILAAMADGRLMLYNASADTFTISRAATAAISGIYAASSLDQFVVGGTVLNASLAAVAQLGSAAAPAEVTAGFSFVDQIGVRTAGTALVGPGNIQRIDINNLDVRLATTRMVEAPLFTPQAATTATTTGTTTTTTAVVGSGFSVFSRTLAVLPNVGTIVSLSQSGITIIPTAFDAAVPTPHLTSIVNSADRTKPVAPGGLVTITGKDLSMLNVATQQIPLPAAIAGSCLTVNGVTLPLILVSGTQINAQLPFAVEGNSQMVLRTPGGVSDNLNFSVLPTAPSVFRSASADTALVVRTVNNEVVSDLNPVHAGDDLTIFATGLGRTSPAILEGTASPFSPLASAIVAPEVTLDNIPLGMSYAGLTPGEIGVYQINVTVPGGVARGASVPLTIRQGSMSTTLTVQVVD